MNQPSSDKPERRGEDGDWISEEQEKLLPTRPSKEFLRAKIKDRATSTDAIMEMATWVAATRLDEISKSGVSLTETRHQQPAFRTALAETQSGAVDQSEIKIALPNWQPTPGGIDVIVRNADGLPRIAAELKLWKTEWMLWDCLKMIDLLNLGDFEAAYMVMGTTERGWSSTYRSCTVNGKTTELFEAGATEHDTAQLFSDNAHAWFDLLTGGTARPTQVPVKIRTTLVAEAPLLFDGQPGSLRTVRVESASDEWLSFPDDWYQGEWPAGVTPCEHYLEWRRLNPLPT